MSEAPRTETRELSECERLVATSAKSQEIGRFLDWLEEQGIWLARKHECDDECDRYCNEVFVLHRESKEKLLARFYDIDLNKVDRERRQMLADLRKQHAYEQINRELGLEENSIGK